MSERVYSSEPVALGRVTIFDEEAKHLARVRRVGIGETVELFDGRGNAWPAEVESIGKDRVELRVVGQLLPDRKPKLDLTLATAIPKGERFDWLVEKASELGVTRLVPLLTERGVVDPRNSKLERLRRLAIESAKQSGRNTLLEINQPVAWPQLCALEAKSGRSRLIAHPGGSLIGTYRPATDSARTATLAIGPEGGFSPSEIDLAIGAGWTQVGLGPTILRIETAAIAASAIVLAVEEGA